MKQLNLASSLILTASAFAISMQGCSPSTTLQTPPADGGSNAAGTATTLGGNGGAGNGGTSSSATGGNTGSGAATATGGTPSLNTGGTPGLSTGGSPPLATGGHVATNTGGSPPVSTGGHVATNTGGSPPLATGGYVATNTGGSPPVATGGAVATSTGGAETTVPTSCTFGTALTVTDTNGYVSTAATATAGVCGGYGYAWTSACGGTGTTPTINPCNSSDITKCPTSTTTVTAFPTGAGLCTTGSAPICSDYSETLGFGFNLDQVSGASAAGTIAQTGTGLAITISATKWPAALRVQVSDNTTPTAVTYCDDISAKATGTTAVTVQIPWSSFNTTCWAPTTGTTLAASTLVTQVQLTIPSDKTTAYSFTNLCITGVTTY